MNQKGNDPGSTWVIYPESDKRPSQTTGFSVVPAPTRSAPFSGQIAPAPAPPTKPPQQTMQGTLVLPPHGTDWGATTQHFSVADLLSRRGEFQALPPPEKTPELAFLPKRRRFGLRLAMVALLAASAAILFLKPDATEPSNAVNAASLTTAEPSAAPQVPSPPEAEAATTPLDPSVTLERAAANVMAEGRYADALPLYRRLAKENTQNPAFAEIVRILERRVGH